MTNHTNLHIGDSYTMLEPLVPEEVRKALTYWHKQLVYDPKKRQRVSQGETRKMYRESTFIHEQTQQVVTSLTTLPGFAAEIYKVLNENGYTVNFLDERSAKPKPDILHACSKLREYQYEAAHKALTSGGGIICAPTGFGKTHLMGALIKAYKKEDLQARGTPLVIVISPSQDLAAKNWNDLCEILPDREVGLITGTSKKFSDDVVVVTPESMDHLPVEEAGLVIYDEVHTLTPKRLTQVSRATRAIRFGVSASPTGRYDGGDKLIEGAFGPIIYRCTYQDAVNFGALVPIKVIWVGVPAPKLWPIDGYSNKDAAYKRGMWLNEGMHKQVKAISDKLPEDWQTLFMVDKLSHMDNLLEFIPEAVCVHAETSKSNIEANKFKNVTAISKKARMAIYDQFKRSELKRVISSGIYRTGVDFPEMRAVVNCEGMGSEIIATQLPGRASRNVTGKECSYLFDFWFNWDTVMTDKGTMRNGFLQADAIKRQKVYAELGFEQVWVDDVNSITLD